MAVRVYSASNRTGVSVVGLLGHRVSNMCLTWQWVFILCPTGQGCLLCASWDTGYLICASHGSGCLFCVQQDRDVYCVPPEAQEHSNRTVGVCWERERTAGIYYVHESVGLSIVCLTWQGYLLCASHDRGVYCVPPGAHDDLMRFTQDSGCLLGT